MLLNTPQNVWATRCARILNVTWVQLCSRLQQAAKRRIDRHPAVTAVPEKPRAPIASSCISHRMTFSCLYASWSFDSIFHDKRAAVLQLFACGSVLFPLDWAARSQLGTRSFFAIHVRVSSHCTHTYRSRWGRATCLSNWAQGLNMERLRAQAPWRSHTQTP